MNIFMLYVYGSLQLNSVVRKPNSLSLNIIAILIMIYSYLRCISEWELKTADTNPVLRRSPPRTKTC